MRIGLLGSPFLGPTAWSSVADRLEERGHQAVCVAPVGDSVTEIAADMTARLGVVDVLVPHSNAGLYVPVVAPPSRARAVVFVDALLPGPGPESQVAPGALADRLDTLADQGVLPSWPRWWSDSELAAELPDPDVRARLVAEAPRLPASYLREAVPAPSGWESLPAAYLAFGDTYAEERARAVALGWPVRTLAGGHLLAMRDPEAVTAALLSLLSLSRPASA